MKVEQKTYPHKHSGRTVPRVPEVAPNPALLASLTEQALNMDERKAHRSTVCLETGREKADQNISGQGGGTCSVRLDLTDESLAIQGHKYMA